ncbi:MAG TPA: polysaccharide deacetylase family protein [Terriglobales bacterium]|nr:polysaccharide deacetylase family protein [Terriglobales bacterium]
MNIRPLLVLAAVTLLCCSSLAQSPQRTIALTFDDLPKAYAMGNTPADIHASTERLLQALQAHKAPAIGFVNEERLFVPGEADARIGILQMWVDAGMELGNHTFSHPDLNKVCLEEYEDDVIRGEVVWRRLIAARTRQASLGTASIPGPGAQLRVKPASRYFRHPYTHTGDTKEKKEGFEAFLESRGYTIAPFTVEHFDYGFNAIYVKALNRGDKELAQRIRAAYLDYLDTMLGFFEQKSRDLFGREIPQILLVHANDINAESADELLTRLEKRGYGFVTLAQALADPAYATKDEYVGSVGTSWLHRWAVTLGKPMTVQDEPDPPKWILDLYKAR